MGHYPFGASGGHECDAPGECLVVAAVAELEIASAENGPASPACKPDWRVAELVAVAGLVAVVAGLVAVVAGLVAVVAGLVAAAVAELVAAETAGCEDR